MQTPSRPGLQHRRGRRGPQPRGAGAGAVRAARHPVHRLGLGDARRSRSTRRCRKKRAAAARHPHAEVPADGDRARAAVVEAEVPADREAERGGLVEGHQRVGVVVDDEEELRAVVRELIERYRQPALVEEYIAGREFTVGLLGDRRPRVLPPMEIMFKDKSNAAPGLRLPGQAGVGEARLLRVPGQADAGRAEGDRAGLPRDLHGARLPRRRARRPAHGRRRATSTCIEVNPLPGLTPGYSRPRADRARRRHGLPDADRRDPGAGLKRLREKRREAKSEAAGRRRAPGASRKAGDASERRRSSGDRRRQRRPPATAAGSRHGAGSRSAGGRAPSRPPPIPQPE